MVWNMSTQTKSLDRVIDLITSTSVSKTSSPKFCAQCLDDINSLQKATAYCKHCKEFICSDACLKHHAKYRLTKHHHYMLGSDLTEFLRHYSIRSKDEDEECTADKDIDGGLHRLHAILRTEIKIRAKADKDICSVHATVVLNNGNVVVGDLKNSNLKLYDTKTRTCLSVMNIANGPRDMCISNMDKNIIYLVENNIRGIHCIDVSDSTLKLVKTIPSDGECYGITCWKFGIAVTTTPFKSRNGKYELRLLDYNGIVRRTFSSEKHVNLEFNLPWFLCSNQSGQRVFISDYGNHTITCIDVDNVVLFVYKDENLIRPVSLVTDSKDDIFVVGQRSHNIHHLTQNNDKKGVIFSARLGKTVLEFPGGLAYDPNGDTFYMQYVGWSDIVQVFNLSSTPEDEINPT